MKESNNISPRVSDQATEYIPCKQSNAKKLKKTLNRKSTFFNDTFLYDGKEYRVNSTEKFGLYSEILSRMISQFEICREKWKRVFVLRFDLHTHAYSKDNKRISAFRKRLFQKLKRHYRCKDIGYCWVREQEKAKTQHYHFVLFLDGDLIRHPKKIIPIIKDSWEDPAGTYTMPFIKKPYHFVDSEQSLQDAIYRISYLAKPRGKGHRPDQTKDFGSSRIKPN